MSFFKKALASIGIGGAKVDTVLENPELQPGDTLKGVIKMMGGKVDQPVDRVYLELLTEVRKGEVEALDELIAETPAEPGPPAKVSFHTARSDQGPLPDPSVHDADEDDVDEETRELLKTLGYIE